MVTNLPVIVAKDINNVDSYSQLFGFTEEENSQSLARRSAFSESLSELEEDLFTRIKERGSLIKLPEEKTSQVEILERVYTHLKTEEVVGIFVKVMNYVITSKVENRLKEEAPEIMANILFETLFKPQQETPAES